jgi:hypothetical protein
MVVPAPVVPAPDLVEEPDVPAAPDPLAPPDEPPLCATAVATLPARKRVASMTR